MNLVFRLLFVLLVLGGGAACPSAADSEDEEQVFYRKLLFTREISVSSGDIASPSAKNRASYVRTAEIVTSLPGDSISFKRSTKGDIADFLPVEEAEDNVPQGLYVGFQDKFLLYIRCYFRTAGDIPATIELDMDKREKKLRRASGLPDDDREVIRSFSVLSQTSLSFYVIDGDKDRLRKNSANLYEIFEGKPMPLEAEEGIY